MKPNDDNLSLEERRRRFIERIEAGNFRRLPTVVAVVPVSQRVAEAVKANPESVLVGVEGLNP